MLPPASQLETELARFERTTRVLSSALGRPARGLSILELGASPLGALLAASGNTVVTVDSQPPPASLRGYLRVARREGVAAAARQLVAHRLREPQLERALAGRTGLLLDAQRPILVRRELTTRLPALDGRTDAVVMAALPSSPAGHGALAAELARVLTPSGVVVVDGQLVTLPLGAPASYRDASGLEQRRRLDAGR